MRGENQRKEEVEEVRGRWDLKFRGGKMAASVIWHQPRGLELSERLQCLQRAES